MTVVVVSADDGKSGRRRISQKDDNVDERGRGSWLGQGPMEFGEHKPESCSGAPPSLRAGEDATLQFLKEVK